MNSPNNTATPDATSEKRKKTLLKVISIVWLLIVIAFFVWEKLNYRGFFGSISEWQFDLVRRNFPITTLMILILIIGSPAIWYLSSTRKVKDAGDYNEMPNEERNRALKDWYFTIRMRNILAIVSAIALTASVAFLIALLSLPSSDGTPRIVDLANAPPSVPNGPVTMSGTILYSQTALYENNIIATSDGFRYAPMVGSEDEVRAHRYFLQFRSQNGAALPVDEAGRITGTLVRNGLPGAIRELYRRNGYAVDQPNYILFTSRYAMIQPRLMASLQLALLSVLIGLFGYIQHRRQKAPPATATA